MRLAATEPESNWRTWPIISLTPAAAAASTARSHSSTLNASGFSHRM
jgi:hypothetical protein